MTLLCRFGKLPLRLASHADMLIAASDDTAFCYGGYDAVGDFIKVPEEPGKEYPRDVYLNCTFVGKYLIANPKTLSGTVLGYAEKNGFELVSVNQGYSGCAVCKVSENAVITADAGISKALTGKLSVLRISCGGIALPGYDTGFIGGASATVGNRVFFFGDVARRSDGNEIVSFVEANGKECVWFPDMPLTDFGGARVVY